MRRSKPCQGLSISLIFMMLALTIQDVAAQRRARGSSASRGSVRYAGKTSSQGSHQTQTRRGSLDTNTSVDGNKTNRETSAEGRYGRSAEGSSTVEREDDKVKWEREVETDSGHTRTVEGELEYGEKIEREATTTNRYGDEVKREQKLENKGGYLEYEGKTETSWGREVEVEGVAGRDYWGRPVAYGTVDTKHYGNYGVARGPYGGRMVTTLPSNYRPVTYYGRPYYTHGGLYYGRYMYRGAWIYHPAYPPYGVYYNEVPVGAIALLVAGATYYYAKSSYYKQTTSQGEVKYEVVQAPSGAQVASLPTGTATITIANTRYSYYNNIFYRKAQQGGKTSYVVVDRPPGLTVVDSLPADFDPLPVEEVTFFMANGVFYLPYFDGKKEVYLVVDQPPQAAQMLASAAASPASAPVSSSFSQSSAPARTSTLTVAAGTVLRVRMANELSTSRQQAGDPFTAYLDSDLLVNGRVVATRGGQVYGRVSKSRAGVEIVLSLTEVSLNYRLAPVITNEVTVDARRSQSLSSSAGADINSVLGGGSGTQGAIQVPAQSVLEFRLQQPLSIELEDGA